MKYFTKAISEETFESWDKQRQDQWLKDHPNSKFKNLDEIKKVRKEIEDKTSFRMSDYAENGSQWLREKDAEDRELNYLNEKLKRLEKKPLHKFRLVKPKEVSPLSKYKLQRDGEPQFSKTLEPFINFSKKTGIRNIDDLKEFAENISRGYDYENIQARKDYSKLADTLLNKYKGTVVHSKDLDSNEKQMIQMLAIYKREKAFYEENEKRKESSEYKKFLEMQDNWNRENNKLKPLIQQWMLAKNAEEKANNNPNISIEEKERFRKARAKLGKELHDRRLLVDKLIKETDDFQNANKSKFPDPFPIHEPIFGKQTIDSEKLGLTKRN